LHLLLNEPIEPKTAGKTLDIGGTEIITYRQLMTKLPVFGGYVA
jgi:hypothetical protein